MLTALRQTFVRVVHGTVGIRVAVGRARRPPKTRRAKVVQGSLSMWGERIPILGNLLREADPGRALSLHHPAAARGRGQRLSTEFPDLPGCMSDGATIEDAIMGGLDAMRGRI